MKDHEAYTMHCLMEAIEHRIPSMQAREECGCGQARSIRKPLPSPQTTQGESLC